MARDSNTQRTDSAQRTDGAQRTDYEKSGGGEGGSKSLDMIRGGGSGGDNSGPTGSSREYPKGGKDNFSADFNPMRDKKRSGTDWAVGGV